jgi:hypothetical protein
MNAEEIIQITKEYASEYIEMTDKPHEFISWVLAKQVIRLMDYIEYLERRLNHVQK